MRTYRPDPDVFTVPANGLDFACLSWGEGPLVLLVHGFPDTARTWDLVGPRLAEAGYRAVAPYTRGIAPTPVPADGRYDSDTLGTDMAALVEALGEEQATIVGHDWGASAAYSAAALFPERFEGMVTVAIPHPAVLRFTPRTMWGVRHFATHKLPGAARRFAKDDFAQIRTLYERWSPDFEWSEAEFAHAKNSYSAPGCMQAAIDYYVALSPVLVPGHKKRIGVRSLIVGGTTDGLMTVDDFERSRGRFTGSVEVAMVPGGHFLHREHPEPFLEVLLAFLAGDKS